MKESKTMTDTCVSKLFLAIGVITILAMALPVAAQVTTGLTSPTAKAKKFASAEDAAKALIEAADKFDETALVEVLGPDSYDIIHTGEPARDREVAKDFASQARVKTNVTSQPKNPRRAFLTIGEDEWPFPVPIVKGASGWSFDTRAGRLEIL